MAGRSARRFAGGLAAVVAAACLGCGGRSEGSAPNGHGGAARGLVGRLAAVGLVRGVLVDSLPVTVDTSSGEFPLAPAAGSTNVPVTVTLTDGTQVQFRVTAPSNVAGIVDFDPDRVWADTSVPNVRVEPSPTDLAGRAWITGLSAGAVVQGTPSGYGPAFLDVPGRATSTLGQAGTRYGVHVLVNPHRAPQRGWYVQFPAVTVDGTSGVWSPPARIQIGDTVTPAVPGEAFALCVVVAPRGSVGNAGTVRVDTPNDIPGVVAISATIDGLIYQPRTPVRAYGDVLAGSR